MVTMFGNLRITSAGPSINFHIRQVRICYRESFRNWQSIARKVKKKTYLIPQFLSPQNHQLNTSDYFKYCLLSNKWLYYVVTCLILASIATLVFHPGIHANAEISQVWGVLSSTTTCVLVFKNAKKVQHFLSKCCLSASWSIRWNTQSKR